MADEQPGLSGFAAAIFFFFFSDYSKAMSEMQR